MSVSEPSSPLKTAKSIDTVGHASSGLPVPDAGLKQTRSMETVDKATMRRNTLSFDGNWLSHLTSMSSNVMEFTTDDEPDNWSHASCDSSMASTTELGLPRKPLSGSAISRRHSTGDKLDLQSTSRRGLSNSMIMTWLSHKRYAPVNAPISESPGDASEGSSSAVAEENVAGVGLTGTGIPGTTAVSAPAPTAAAPLTGTPITGTGLTAAANAIVAGNDPSKLAGVDAQKKIKVNFRELNAVAPSFW